jgi:hypothetical protein
MLVFSGLWTLSDKEGRFQWKPRTIKLDILPFLDFDMEDTLDLLEENGFIRSYIVNNERYGLVLTFPKHQRITGKEHDSEPRCPAPDEGETTEKHPGAQEGKGKEREREKERSVAVAFDIDTRSWSGIVAEDMDAWAGAYPACNISQELAKAGEWLIANPARAVKSNYRRFIVNWLSRSQDRGGGAPSNRPTVDMRVGENKYKDDKPDGYWAEVRRLKATGLEGESLTAAMKEWEGREEK